VEVEDLVDSFNSRLRTASLLSVSISIASIVVVGFGESILE
jgi:hypothetical protein